MKSVLKKLASNVNVETYQRLLAYSILRNSFIEVTSCQTFSKRETLWDAVINLHNQSNDKITYIEFGVHEGYSLNYFSKRNINEHSVFIGLDSFEGLPEDWGLMPKGTFNTNGRVPITEDTRVSFIKGWFQKSWVTLEYQLLAISNIDNLIVHYDADLYSSTLFALTKIDTLKQPYLAIFDEFTGHETRALYNYIQAYSATVEFFGKTTMRNGYPNQVVCRVIPIGNVTTHPKLHTADRRERFG